MENINIETDNLIIRTFLPSDAKDAAYYSQQPKVAYWMSDMVLHDESEALSWIHWLNERVNINEPFIILAIEHKARHKCIGVVGVHAKAEIDNEVEILYGVSDSYQGNGYATEASKALIQWVFKNTQLKNLTAIVKPENIQSKAVIKKLGFQCVDSKIIPYDGHMCKFDYYKLYNCNEITMTNGSMLTKEFDKQINDLMLECLDFSFDKFHAKGVWNDDYERYSIFDNDIMAASISVYKMKMLINGEQKDFLQIGAVATKEEYRGKGLSRKIMEHIFTKYPDTPAFLHGGNSVLNFYPKFGFRPFEEKQPYIEYKLDNQGDMVKLDINDPKVDRYLKERNRYSKVIDCVNHYAINWFHLLYRHSKDIYEIPQLDLMIIARQKDNVLIVYDIAAKRNVTFEEILPHLSFQGVDIVQFTFIPDWLEVDYRMKGFKIDDCNPFVKGSFGVDGEFMIPRFITT